MKKNTKALSPLFPFCAALVLLLIVACAGGAETVDSGTAAFGGGVTASGAARQVSSEVEVKALSEVEGKEWILMELRSGGNTVRIDRVKYEADNMSGFYTISFHGGRVSGVGAPNRYFGPYTAGSGEDLSIGVLASTLMASFREPDELNEHEYYDYISKTSRWAVRDGKLELYSTSDGRETVLVFELM